MRWQREVPTAPRPVSSRQQAMCQASQARVHGDQEGEIGLCHHLHVRDPWSGRVRCDVLSRTMLRFGLSRSARMGILVRPHLQFFRNQSLDVLPRPRRVRVSSRSANRQSKSAEKMLLLSKSCNTVSPQSSGIFAYFRSAAGFFFLRCGSVAVQGCMRMHNNGSHTTHQETPRLITWHARLRGIKVGEASLPIQGLVRSTRQRGRPV